jgi:signal transduction histidine kinase/HAMP domain-containing protein
MKWVLGYTRSQAVLDSELTGRLQRDILFMAGIIAITVIVLAISARQMVRPIGRLATAAQSIAGGDWVELPPSGADPDVHRLEQAFAAMSKAVAEREEGMRDQARVLATLEAVGSRLASDLDFDSTVQSITDAGTRLTQAAFGSFFYNVTNAEGESYFLYAISGVDPEAFANFPMPRNTAVFSPTFNGEGVVRVDDITQDPRYGKNAPHFGMPAGHLPVRSYLAAPVFGRGGEVMGALFFGHPEVGVFTQRHEELAIGIASWAAIALNNASLYQQSQQAQEELRRSNDAKDEFLGVVSHELRTPTTTIYGGIRMLDTRRHLLSQDATAELIHTMSEEADRLVRLIENLLVFARLELGSMPEMEPTSLKQLADAAAETFNRIHPTRPLSVTIAEDLPVIFAQPTSIERVMENLLSNADKYGPADEPISLVVQREGEALTVCVRDKGHGVPDQEMERIFDSFYRAQKASQVATGHGLGLSISKRIIDSHEGRIWAKNLPGGGFEVGFALPVTVAPVVADVVGAEV